MIFQNAQDWAERSVLFFDTGALEKFIFDLYDRDINWENLGDGRMVKTKNKAMRLLKKGKQGFWRLIFGRTGIITLLLALQVGLLIWASMKLQTYLPHFMAVYVAFSAIMVVYLVNVRMEPSVKLTWLVVIMVVPVAGALLYLFTKSEIGHRALRQRLGDLKDESQGKLEQSEPVLDAVKRADPGAAGLVHYVGKYGPYPVYDETEVTYFPLGEDKFAAMLSELEKAERFIFLEYYIVSEGEMWGQILEILARKAAQGVDVRVMYDGTCEFYLLPRDYPERLQKLGIACKTFSPVMPFLSTHYNYRDHRKILVIDGHTAFTGGVNLADEYINQKNRFGHWKDTAVMVQGKAVKSFTLMFLQMWNVNEGHEEFDSFLSTPTKCPERGEGFVMPYADSPLDGERVGEKVYLDILRRAERYVHIMTPYLIIDHEMENALRYAAQRGVEVKLILPGTPDKKSAYALAKTHLPGLMEAGVEIYFYTPGFLHAKSFVCDDREAVVGTINLDYRSLYHHFECAVWMYGVDAVADVERDFQSTMAVSALVTEETLKKQRVSERMVGFLLKFLAPLL